MGYLYPDGCTAADIDNAIQSEWCWKHRVELNVDGSCDECVLEFSEPDEFGEPEEFEPPRSDYHGD